MALFRRRRWPLAVAAVVVVAAVALAALLLSRGGDDGTPDALRDPAEVGGTEVVETADPLPEPTLDGSDVQPLLTAPDAELKRHVDSQVTADNVAVQAVLGPDAVWVGESAEDRVLVVITGTEQSFSGVQPGARLSFAAQVRALTPRFARLLGARGDDLRELTRQAIYLEISAYRAA